MKKICIVDDSEMFRHGVRSILENKSKFEIIEASSGAELLSIMQRKDGEPILILLDVKLKKSDSMSGIDIAKIIKNKYPASKIIILTTYDEKDILKSALEAGVEGFLPKDSLVEELISAINCVCDNQNYLGKTIPFHAISYAFSKQSNKIDILTKTEQLIFLMICKGYKNNQIAEKLFISIHTVETHKSNIKSKLSIKNDIDFIRIAIEENISEIMNHYEIQKQ